MPNYDRKEHLKTIHASRKALNKKVDEAVKRLIRANESINFNSVASEAGVAKATLYNHPELRERVETLRQKQAHTPTAKQVKRDMNDANKAALIETLKRKVKKLESENKDLREQIKVAYAQIYEKT